MKSRILLTLEELAKGPHAMSDDLMLELKINQEQLSTRSDKLLRSILHNYSFFAVTTIDAFFQKIVRSFAREIGIQSGFKIELDQPKVISDVIDQMLSEMANDPQMIRWLTEFAIYQINQGKSWDTRNDIKRLSGELFSEFLVLNRHRVFKQLDDPEFMSNFIKSLNDRLNQLQHDFKSIGKNIKGILDRNNLSSEDFTHKSAGVGGYMEKVIEGKFTEPLKRVYAALKENKWYSKGSDSAVAVEQAIASGLANHLSLAVDYYLKNNREYQSLSQVIKYIF